MKYVPHTFEPQKASRLNQIWRTYQGLLIASLAFLVGLLLVIAFATRINTVQHEIDHLISSDRDAGLWTATQIQTELLEFQRLAQEAKFNPKSLEDDIRADFDIVYSRLSQALDSNIASAFHKDEKNSTIPADMIRYRDLMADIVDMHEELGSDELNDLIGLAKEAEVLWKKSISVVLQDARGYKVSVRERAAETLRSVENTLWLAVFISVALTILTVILFVFRKNYKEIRRNTLIDTLTGCASRRGLDEALTNTFSKINGGFSVAIADINNLKEINDQYGHQVGDRAIQIVGSALRKITRGIDCPARVGGDEFVILLDATAEQAEGVMQRAQEFLAQRNGSESLDLPPIEISVGVAHCGDFLNIDEAISLADQRMYRQKRAVRKSSVSNLSVGAE